MGLDTSKIHKIISLRVKELDYTNHLNELNLTNKDMRRGRISGFVPERTKSYFFTFNSKLNAISKLFIN